MSRRKKKPAVKQEPQKRILLMFNSSKGSYLVDKDVEGGGIVETKAVMMTDSEVEKTLTPEFIKQTCKDLDFAAPEEEQPTIQAFELTPIKSFAVAKDLKVTINTEQKQAKA